MKLNTKLGAEPGKGPMQVKVALQCMLQSLPVSTTTLAHLFTWAFLLSLSFVSVWPSWLYRLWPSILCTSFGLQCSTST